MKTQPSDETDTINDSEPGLIRAMKRWNARCQAGCIQPPLEAVLQDLLLDERELMRAIAWCLDLERLPWLLELRHALENCLKQLSARPDLTLREALKLHRYASRQIDSITLRLQRAKCADCPFFRAGAPHRTAQLPPG